MADLAVGDVLTTAEQLDACPEGTIVRYSDFWIFVRRDDGEWEVVPQVAVEAYSQLLARLDTGEEL